jgi:hypothetical protein
MKSKSLLVAAALAGAAFSTSAFAYSPKDATKPAPRVSDSSVVEVTGLPRSFTDSVVNIEFALDAAGKPHDIKVLHVSDANLQRRVIASFSQWRFDVSATKDAVLPKRFILPLEIRAQG